MNELQQVLNNIEQDKNTNLLPGNLRDNVTCLGVEGTAEVPIPIYATTDYSIKELSLLHYGNNTNYIHHINNFYITVSYDSPSRYDKIYVDIYEIENDNLVHKYSYSKTFGLLYTYIYPFASKENTLYFYSYSNDSGTSIEKMDLTAETLQLTSIGSSKDVSVTWVVDSKLLIGRNYSFYFDISNERVTKIKSPATKYCGGYYVMGNTNLWKFDTNTISWVDLGVLNNTTLNSSVCFTKDGSKVFIDGDLYSVINDSVGELLKENVYNYENTGSSSSDRYLVQINDKYFGLINGSRIYSLYEFDNSSNTLTLVSDIDCYFSYITQDICSSSSSTQILSYYVFDKGNVQIGIIYDGNNLYFSSSEIGMSSSNVLQGTIMYDKNYNQIIGTMPNNGELNITPTTENQNIPEGYTSGGTVLGDENLKSENIKKDVSIFGVTGSLESSSGQIKLFETVEEMQADSTAKEGDLAVVYREEIQNMTATSNSQYITFPETVKLPSQLTSSYYGMIRAVDPSTNYFDGMVQLNSSSFRFDGYGDIGSIIVEYESSDGTNYTRTTFTLNSEILTNPVDMSTPIGPYYEEDWNDLFGYFMQVNGKYFDGLYEYGTYIDYFKVYMYRNLTVSDENVTYDSKVPFDFNTIENVLHTFMEDNGRTVDTHFLITLKNDIVKLYYDYVTTSYPDTTYYYLDGNNWYASYEDGSSFTKCTKHIEINLSDLSIQFVEDDGQLDMTSDSVCVLYYYQTRKLQDTLQMIFYVNSHNIYFDVEFAPTSEYIIADNQYTLASSNQLLPGISGYGKNGTVVGDDSLYSNLEWSEDVLSNCPTDVYLSYINKPYNSQNLSIIYNTKQKANVEHGISFNGSNLYILSFEINIDKIKSIVGEDEMQYQSFNINRIYALGNKLYIVCVDYNPSNDDSAYNIFIVMYDTHSSLYTVSKFNSVDNDVSVGQWLSGRPVVQLTEDKSHLIIFMNILENTYNKIDEATDCYMQVIDYNIIEDTFNLILNCKLNDMIFDSIENASAYAQSAWKYNNTVYFSHSEMRSTPSLCTYNRLDAIDINTQKVTNVYTQSVDSIWSLPRFNSWMNGYRILLDNNMCYFLKYSSDRKVTLSKLNMDDNTISDLKQLPITLKSNHVSHETYDMRKEGNIIYLYTDFATDGASSSDFYRVCVYMYNIEDSTLTTIYEADVDEHDGDSGSHGHFVISNNHLYLMTESLHLEIKGNQVTPIEVPYGQDFGNGQHYDVNGITYSTGINEGLQVVLADSKITNDLSSRFTLMVTSYPQEQYSGRTGILYKISDTDNSTPISQDEYNEAVDITKQILGIE